jgi:hypothetical protein
LDLTNFSARNASPPGVVAALDPANTDDLEHLAPEADRRAVEGLFVGVDAGALPDEVGFERADEAGALDDLPAAEGDDGCLMSEVVSIEVEGFVEVIAGWLTEDEHGVVDEEVLDTPGPEGRVSVEENDEDHPSHSNVSLSGKSVCRTAEQE